MKLDTLLICFLIAFWSGLATGARQQLRSDVLYNERNHNDGSGRYQYGYAVKQGARQFQHQRSLDGAMYGCYGYLDPQGKLFITHYLADMAGYRLVNMVNPDKKLMEKIRTLGSADHPVELQSFFPLECQADGDIKILQETAAQMSKSLPAAERSYPSGIDRSTSNYQASDTSTKHSEELKASKSFDQVSVESHDSAVAEDFQERKGEQQSQDVSKLQSDEETTTTVHHVEPSATKTFDVKNTLSEDSTVQLSNNLKTDVPTKFEIVTHLKDSIESSKKISTTGFRSHATGGGRFHGVGPDGSGYIRVAVVDSNNRPLGSLAPLRSAAVGQGVVASGSTTTVDSAARKTGGPNLKSNSHGMLNVNTAIDGSASFDRTATSSESSTQYVQLTSKTVGSAIELGKDDVVGQEIDEKGETFQINKEQTVAKFSVMNKDELESLVVSTDSVIKDDSLSVKTSATSETQSIIAMEPSAEVELEVNKDVSANDESEVAAAVTSVSTISADLNATSKDESSSVVSSENAAVIEGSLTTAPSLKAESLLTSEDMNIVNSLNTENANPGKFKLDGKPSSIAKTATAELKLQASGEQKSTNNDESVKITPVSVTAGAQQSSSLFRGRTKYQDYATSSAQAASNYNSGLYSNVANTKTTYNSGQYNDDYRGSVKPSHITPGSGSSSGQSSLKPFTDTVLGNVQGSDRKATNDIQSIKSTTVEHTRHFVQDLGYLRGSIKSSSVSFKPDPNTIESVQLAGTSSQSPFKSSTVQSVAVLEQMPAVWVPDNAIITKTGDTGLGNVQDSLRKSSTSYQSGTYGIQNMKTGDSLADIKSSVESSSDFLKSGSGGTSNQSTYKSPAVDAEVSAKRVSNNVDSSMTDASSKSAQVLGDNKKSVSSEFDLNTIQSVQRDGSLNQSALKSSTVATELAMSVINQDHDGIMKTDDSGSSGQVFKDIKDSVRSTSVSFKQGSNAIESVDFGISSTHSTLTTSIATESAIPAIRTPDTVKITKPNNSAHAEKYLGNVKDPVRSFSLSNKPSSIQSAQISGSSSQMTLKSSSVEAGSTESFNLGSSISQNVENGGPSSSSTFKSSSEDAELGTKQLSAFRVADNVKSTKAGDSTLSSQPVGDIKGSVSVGLGSSSSPLTFKSTTVEVESAVPAIRVQENDIVTKASDSVGVSQDLGDIKNSIRSSSESFKQGSNDIQNAQVGGSSSQSTFKLSTVGVGPAMSAVKSHSYQDIGNNKGPLRSSSDSFKSALSESVELGGSSSQSTIKSSTMETVSGLRRIPAIRVPEYVERRIMNAAYSKASEQPPPKYAFSSQTKLTSGRPIESKITSVSNFGANVEQVEQDGVVQDLETDEDIQRMMIPKLPATPRTTTVASSLPVTIAYSIASNTNKPPGHPSSTTVYRPSISDVYYQATTSTTTVRPIPARTTIGPSGDIYDEIDEELELSIPPVSTSRPIQMSPQIPFIPSSGSGITIQPSMASNCYEVILKIPADAKQVLLKTDSSTFRVYGDDDPNNRIKLVQPGVYEVNVGATSGIKFEQYQHYPHKDVNKLKLDLGKGFNYGELVPTPANRGAVDHRDPTLNNPYLPQVTIEQARSVGSAELVAVGADSHELTIEQRALLNLVPSWKKVFLYY